MHERLALVVVFFFLWLLCFLRTTGKARPMMDTGCGLCAWQLTEASVSIPVGSRRAPVGADAVAQHVALHALQAVGAQGPSAGVAAPVALCAIKIRFMSVW